MNFFKFFSAVLISALLLSSCSSDDSTTQTPQIPLGDYENGILILNEGNFGTDNSTISYLSYDFATFQSDAYLAVNNEALGNTGQSIGFYNNLAFVVVNGSNKIEILNRFTLQKVATISTGLNNPRYISFSNGKGYVTNWGDGGNATDDYVAVVNLNTFSISSTISVIEGPEKIIAINNNLYVAHKGGYGYGNSISVINSNSDAVSNTIAVGDIPSAMKHVNDYLYVLCSGKESWTGSETQGKLVKIKVSDNSTTELNFATTEHPSNLDIYNSEVFYTLNNSVYKMAITDVSLPTFSFLDLSTTQGTSYNFAYGFAIRNDKIFVADAKDYSSNGFVYVYNLNGTLFNSFEVKTSPSGFYFN